MKKFLITLAIIGFTLTASKQAHAIFIVDTGPGPILGGNSVFNSNPGAFQFLAGQFQTTQSYNVNSLQGWFDSGSIQAGTIDAVLYGDNSNSVNQLDEITRQNFFIFQTSEDDDANWFGVSGLNQPLAPGTYWLAFETNLFASGGYSGSMPFPVGAPLNRHTFKSNSTGGNYIPVSGGWGFRIDATESSNVIPEPATMLLFGGGMAGMLLRRRKKG